MKKIILLAAIGITLTSCSTFKEITAKCKISIAGTSQGDKIACLECQKLSPKTEKKLQYIQNEY